MSQLAPIFIGGTGRSGTTLLYDVLRTQKDIFVPPREMRFFIDPDGLLNLFQALHENFSPAQSAMAYLRFARLMQEYMVGFSTERYPYYQLPDFLGKKAYQHTVQQFLDGLCYGTFQGQAFWMPDPHLNGLPGLWRKIRRRMSFLPAWGVQEQQSIPLIRYFPDEQELAGIFRQFVYDLFEPAMQQTGARVWCEKTPLNILHLKWIWTIFPDALFIHLKRDPRGVAQSYRKQAWAPADLPQSCQQLADIYSRWEKESTQIAHMGKSDQYWEIKLEDFAREPEKWLEQIMAYNHLSVNASALTTIETEKVNYWEKKLSAADRNTINQILGPHIQKMGYKL